MIRCHLYRAGVLEEGAFDPARMSDVLGEDDVRLWLDAADPSESELELLKEEFRLHDLLVEDMRHRDQRPKVELYDGVTFVVARPLLLASDGELVEGELHAVLGERFLVTTRFGRAADLGDAVRRAQRPILAEGDTLLPFLLYVVVDEIVDGYLEVADRFEDLADDLENHVFTEAEPDADPEGVQQQIFRLKRDVVRFRRHVGPLRRVIDFLAEDQTRVPRGLSPYYRDVSDHVLRAVEFADNIREVLTALLEVRVAQAANRLNEVMKRLTSWAAIILVPTLIAGIYGMNFEHMPEVEWTWGYPAALATMLIAATLLWWMFRRRGWI